MCKSCQGRERTVLDSFPAESSRADQRAEWIAGERRAGAYPEAHVHFDLTADAFTVVTPAGVEIDDDEMEL